ncbi:hypothetical protein [Parasphingorhabdus sp.]|uniref:hypothetical protein n=1 Tax=Parasphingorhabdus sp. TaxID=2709688 RepID=UPI002F939591
MKTWVDGVTAGCGLGDARLNQRSSMVTRKTKPIAANGGSGLGKHEDGLCADDNSGADRWLSIDDPVQRRRDCQGCCA